MTSQTDRTIEWLLCPWVGRAGAAARASRVLVVALGLTLVILPAMILYFGIDGWWWDTTVAVLCCAPLGIILLDNVAELVGRLAGRQVVGLSRVAMLFVGLSVGVLGGYAIVMAVHVVPDRSVGALWRDYRRTMSILLPVLTVVAVLGASLWYRGEAFRLESALATARFDALSGQMQPHFLFNALNALKALIDDDPAQAVDVTQRVADLYRLIMKVSKDPTATLGERSRSSRATSSRAGALRRSLRYQIDVPTDLSTLHVPSLVLQTLVENAVKHGVCKVREGGEVRVRAARKSGGRLELEVSNTGAPTIPRPAHPSLAAPTGLANTRARLSLMYGASNGFAIDSDPKLGTRVTLYGLGREDRLAHAHGDPLRVLIVDDEALARKSVARHSRSALPDATSTGGPRRFRGAEQIRAFAPQLVFLDVEMPELSGLDVLRQLAEPRPEVVFVTAFEHFAVEAFDRMPATTWSSRSPKRVRRDGSNESRTARRGREASSVERSLENDGKLPDPSGARARPTDRSRSDGQVSCFVSKGHYSYIHAGGREYISELTLVHLEERLDPAFFVRIHRNALVNESCVKRLIDGVPAMVELDNGMQLELSRRNRSALILRYRDKM